VTVLTFNRPDRINSRPRRGGQLLTRAGAPCAATRGAGRSILTGADGRSAPGYDLAVTVRPKAAEVLVDFDLSHATSDLPSPSLKSPRLARFNVSPPSRAATCGVWAARHAPAYECAGSPAPRRPVYRARLRFVKVRLSRRMGVSYVLASPGLIGTGLGLPS